MRLFPRVSVSAFLSLAVLSSSLLAKGEGPASYVVLTVTTMEGKVSYKPIAEKDRKYNWPLGRRPDDHPSLSDLGL